MIESAIARYRVAKDSLVQNQEALATTKKTLATALEAREAIQVIAEQLERKAHRRIEAIVSKCLAAVFDDPYEFRINYERKRGNPTAEMVFVRNEEELDPLTASGGGVVDIASFALRIAALSLKRPRPRQLVVLDEPFKFVAVDLRDKVKAMIELLARELDIQFIIVTHMPELTCGKVIEL